MPTMLPDWAAASGPARNCTCSRGLCRRPSLGVSSIWLPGPTRFWCLDRSGPVVSASYPGTRTWAGGGGPTLPTRASGLAGIGPAGRIGGRGAYPRSGGRVLDRAGRGNRHHSLEPRLGLGVGGPTPPNRESGPAGIGPAGRIGGRGAYPRSGGRDVGRAGGRSLRTGIGLSGSLTARQYTASDLQITPGQFAWVPPKTWCGQSSRAILNAASASTMASKDFFTWAGKSASGLRSEAGYAKPRSPSPESLPSSCIGCGRRAQGLAGKQTHC